MLHIAAYWAPIIYYWVLTSFITFNCSHQMKSAISIPWQALNVSMFYTSFLNDSKYAIFVQLFLEEQADNSAQSYWVSNKSTRKN